MKYFLILKLMLISKIGISQIMLPAYHGVVSKIPAVVTPSFSCGPSTVSDIDGNVYNTVLIGTQCWTKENLRVRKYNDGTAIPLNTVSSVWQGLTTGAYTIYGNEASSGTNATNYGFLYNWYAAKGIITAGGTSTKNICPTGFHVPTDSDWNKLVKFINSLADTTINGLQSSPAGTKLKKNDALWTTNTGNTGTDNYGFSGLPGGYRGIDGSFISIRNVAVFWCATEYDVDEAWNRVLYYNGGYVKRSTDGKKSLGGSIRCILD